MKALITGASSGLGYEMAKCLSRRGYDIIAVARREDRLNELKNEVSTNVEALVLDVTKNEDIEVIVNKLPEVDILINNAGFGVFGALCETELERELKMLDTNIRAVHILTKEAAKIFKRRDSGKILNVASLAAFFAGPLFSSYYASKNYVLRLGQALSEELRRDKSRVTVSTLCPGPVKTEFGDVAKVSFGNGSERGAGFIILNKEQVAEYAIKKMLRGKKIIIPGALMKIGAFMRRVLPESVLARALYLIQSKKCIDKNR